MLRTDDDYQITYGVDDEISDEQIYKSGMEEWVGTVAQLWDVNGRDVDMRQLDAYCKQLRDVPLGLLEIGIHYAIKNNTYKTIPAVGLIYEGIHKALDRLNMPPKTDIDTKIERWVNLRFNVHRFGG